MKRKLELLFILILLSGCTVNYNVKFDGSTVYESIDGTVSNFELLDDENRTDVNPYYYRLYFDQSPLIDDDNVLYKKEIKDLDNEKSFNFSYTYFNNFSKSKIINYCFSEKVIDEDDSYYHIKLSGDFNCLYSDSVTINVTSDYKVFEHNADKVKGNTYTWIIDKNTNADIDFGVSKIIKSDEKDVSYFKLIAFIIFIILSLITYFLYRKKESNNI